MVQEIEAITRYGRTVVLKIPKGQALVPFRASRAPTPTSKNHSADSSPNSQVSEDNVTVDSADRPTSSQSTSEASNQPEHSKIQILEKVGSVTYVE
jgi:cytoskeletal protein RodZ